MIPQIARRASKQRPVKKIVDGIPSMIRLVSLPKNKPPINNIFISVAVAQSEGLIIPINQKTDTEIYKPINALKILAWLISSILKLSVLVRMLLGFNP